MPLACSSEPELDQEYIMETYTQKGVDAKPTRITAPGWKWIEDFHKDHKAWEHLDCHECIIDEWQAKFDDIGLRYNCRTQELDVDAICLDRACKYL